jgi:hypothetical protein
MLIAVCAVVLPVKISRWQSLGTMCGQMRSCQPVSWAGDPFTGCKANVKDPFASGDEHSVSLLTCHNCSAIVMACSQDKA